MPHPPGASATAQGGLVAQAEAVWDEMRACGVLPTPRNYELWFTFRTGANTELTQRLDGLMVRHDALGADVLDTLYRDCIAVVETDLDTVVAESEAIQAAAQTLVEQVAASQDAIRGYGDALGQWRGQLAAEPTAAGLVQVVASLATETSRACARNRLLEQQLTASAARITRLRQNLAEVRQEATTDSLTGIANRRAFDARLRRAVGRGRPEQDTVSVLIIDIDHFKQFNDTHGHRTGDLVLRLVARVLADNIKGRDTAARYGGEEFAVLLAGAELRAAAVVARQISEALSAKRLVNKGTAQGLGHITISVGVAQHHPGESPAAFVERADLALYEAKRTGRNRVCAAPMAA